MLKVEHNSKVFSIQTILRHNHQCSLQYLTGKNGEKFTIFQKVKIKNFHNQSQAIIPLIEKNVNDVSTYFYCWNVESVLTIETR